MKRKIALFLLIPMLFMGFLFFGSPTADPSYNDGSVYVLDLDNPSTYTVSCYDVLTSSQWVVKNSTCTLTTSVINLPGDPAVDPDFDVPINFTFSSSGNLESDDDILIQFKIDSGDWEELAHIEGDLIVVSPTEYGYIVSEVSPGSDIQFRVIMKTNNAAERLTMHTSGGSDMIAMVGTPYLHGTYELFKSASLPVTLVSFTGNVDKEKVVLKWLTSSEINNDHFEIERTSDGNNFQTVTVVQGAGNSNITRQYKAEDYSPVSGTNYYRIKQVDFDGKYTFSDLITVNIENSDKECKLSVRPNPCIGECQVFLEDCPQAAQNGFIVYMYDALGNVVQSKTNPMGDNTAAITLDANSIYKPGVYIVRAKIDENTVIDEKVVISK